MASELILSLKRRKNSYGSKLKILSPAKINLYLNIIGKYSNGFHRLESMVERVSLFDKITIKIEKNPAIKISSNIKSLQNDKNLCFKAARLLQKRFKIPFGFSIFLDKKIPVGAGLGGGSSNAASVILGIDELLRLNLTRNELYKLGEKLGSDVNFFLCQEPFAFLEGKGEKVTPFDIKKKFKHFIVWPKIHVSTEKVYKNFRAKLTKNFNNAKMLKYALKKEDIFLIQKNVFNILEKSACAVYGKLERAKKHLDDSGIFFKMSGSGSAFYTVRGDISARKVREAITPAWAVFEVKTF